MVNDKYHKTITRIPKIRVESVKLSVKDHYRVSIGKEKYEVFFSCFRKGKLSIAKENNKHFHRNYLHFMAIKNHFFGEESLYIEIYPPMSEHVNNKNTFHLWQIEKDSPFYNEVFDNFNLNG